MLLNNLKFRKQIKTHISLLFIVFITNQLIAAPTTTYHDPTIIYSPRGIYRFKNPEESKKISLRKPSFSITPYYQSASGARNKDGIKVPLGDRLGQWNMMALFYGFDASPIEKKFDLRGKRIAFPITTLTNGKGFLDTTPKTGDYPGALATAKTNYPNLYKAFQTIFDHNTNSLGGAAINRPNVALLAGINADASLIPTQGIISVPLKFEKVGARTECILNLTKQLSIIVQSGFADYKQSAASYNDQTVSDTAIQLTLTTTSALKLIAQDLGINLTRVANNGLEDTNVKIAFSKECPFLDDKNNLMVNINPWLALGAWIPTAKKQCQDNPYSLALGNDGFFGLSLEGALNFDFPELLTLGFGGGISIFQKQTLFNQRCPSDPRQVGLIPWKTDMNKRLGAAWNFNISLQARNFIEKLSCYADYTFAKKERDEIELTNENTTPHTAYALQVAIPFTGGGGIPLAANFSPVGIPSGLNLSLNSDDVSIYEPQDYPINTLFYPEKLQEESEWKAQTLNCGLIYDLTKDLSFGFGFVTHFAGLRVYKSHTFMGSVNFTF